MKEKNGLAVAGFVLGIIGIVFSFIPIINTVGYVLGALALIFGIIGVCKKGKKALAIIAIILAIATITITTVMKITVASAVADVISDSSEELQNSLNDITGDNTDEILENDVDVVIGDYIVDDNEYFPSGKLEVTVTNKSSEQASFYVEIEAIGTDGVRITTDTVYVSNLNAGQSQKSDAFTLVTSDELEKLKTATFKVNSVSKY